MTCKVSLLPGKHAKGKKYFTPSRPTHKPCAFYIPSHGWYLLPKTVSALCLPGRIVQLCIIRFIDAFMLADIFQHLFFPGFDGFGRNIFPFYFLGTFFFNHLLQTVGTAKIHPVDRNTKPDFSVFLRNFPGTQRRGEMPDPTRYYIHSQAPCPYIRSMLPAHLLYRPN